MTIDVTLNGEPRTLQIRGDDSLLEVLRRNGLTGAKRGCNEGSCGFCTVLVDGVAEKSCLIPAAAADGADIETVEGLGSPDDLDPIQAAFVDNAALQCGYCIPGMIMRTKGLLETQPDPSRAEIRRAISSNLCRCTGYEKILDAIEDAEAARQRAVATDGGTCPCVEEAAPGGDQNEQA